MALQLPILHRHEVLQSPLHKAGKESGRHRIKADQLTRHVENLHRQRRLRQHIEQLLFLLSGKRFLQNVQSDHRVVRHERAEPRRRPVALPDESLVAADVVPQLRLTHDQPPTCTSSDSSSGCVTLSSMSLRRSLSWLFCTGTSSREGESRSGEGKKNWVVGKPRKYFVTSREKRQRRTVERGRAEQEKIRMAEKRLGERQKVLVLLRIHVREDHLGDFAARCEEDRAQRRSPRKLIRREWTSIPPASLLGGIEW